ncbi:uncharacterized protein LOC135091770 [Scylla paramamosain]|uniref:uncharacterized protein LOC135091770 n=1 Tax=Scylla paramamosain TaxID=85552 RepID=UPI00308314A4
MLSKYRKCYLYLVIGVLLALSLHYIPPRVIPTTLQAVAREGAFLTEPKLLQSQVRGDSDHSVQEQPVNSGQEHTSQDHGHSRRLEVMPVMGTQLTNASRATILDCAKGEPRDSKPAAGETPGPLHECSVEVELSPCSCKRTITVRLPEPCFSTSPGRLLQHIKDSLGESACSDIATLRGAGQKVVSYSVGGLKSADYVFGAQQLVPRVAEMYPGWIMRLYTDASTDPYTWVCPFVCTNPHLDVCDAAQLPGLGNVSRSHPRMWRFATMGDPLVRLYLMRDADGPLVQREVDAVNHWLQAGTCYHVMRDHPFHGVSMLAGMWGGCLDKWNPKENVLRTRAISLCSTSTKVNDQAVLGRELWPVARRNATVHDAYTCRIFPGSLPFPSRRFNFTFVGMRSYRKRFRNDKVPKRCPAACRPKEHQDWLYC